MEAKKDIKLIVLNAYLVISGASLQYTILKADAAYNELYINNIEMGIELEEAKKELAASREVSRVCIELFEEEKRQSASFYDDLEFAYDELLECELGQPDLDYMEVEVEPPC